MIITHSFVGTVQGRYRYLFFLIVSDSFELQSSFTHELMLLLERFDRNLEGHGAIVRPFVDDIHDATFHLMQKPWPGNEINYLANTPGLLMINTSFDDFDPRIHPWLHVHFGHRYEEGLPGASAFRKPLAQLVELVKHSEEDVFQQAHSVMSEFQLSDVGSIFEAKPGIFGFSIDLKKGASVLVQMYERFIAKRNSSA